MNSASPLAELLAYMAEARSASHLAAPESVAAGGQDRGAAELPSIDYFRRTWSKVSTNRLLRESQAHVPDNAGPLNSSQLVHRALSVMRDASPDYLHHVLLYLDALSWMEQLKEASHGAGAKGGGAGTSMKSGGNKGRNGVRRSGGEGKKPAGKSR